MRLIFVSDTETTGFGAKDEVIQFAGLLYDLDAKKIIGKVEEYFWTQAHISPGALQTHKINKDKLLQLSGRKTLENRMINYLDPYLFNRYENLSFGFFNSKFDIRLFNQSLVNNGYIPPQWGPSIPYSDRHKLGTKRSNFCLMEYSKAYLKVSSVNLVDAVTKCGLKHMEIREEFERVFPGRNSDAHDALYDSFMTLKVAEVVLK